MSKDYGMLLHISSIPTKEPIGNIGKDAYAFLDFLTSCGAKYWQILPLQPVDHTHSPYASLSAFAGEIRYIDIYSLDDKELIDRYKDSLDQFPEPKQTDYEAALELKLPILREYFRRRKSVFGEKLEDFRVANPWVWDYCLFESLKAQFNAKSWIHWPEGIRIRDPRSLEFYSRMVREDMEFLLFCQYLFFHQWTKLKKAAVERNISIIGDIPMYVPLDSVEVWSKPSLFCLDHDLIPVWVSGAPPDYFSPSGQRWNTPVYDWSVHKADGYQWWKKRIAHNFKCCDILRLDHFRGFTSYWSVPPEEEDARGGHWETGPGMDLLSQLKDTFANQSFIVEDLGDITAEVRQMKEDFSYPGMAVFQFGFNGDPENSHLPMNVTKGQVYYTGTHDNPPLPLWYEDLDDSTKNLIHEELGEKSDPIVDKMLEKVLDADSFFSMIQFQDLLPPDSHSRMNTPGTVGENWVYKVPSDLPMDAIKKKLLMIAKDQPHD